MITWLNALTPWSWFYLALMLATCELVLGTNFFLLWLGLAASCVGTVLAFVPMSWEMQCVLFSVLDLASVGMWLWWSKQPQKHTQHPLHLNDREAQLVGKTFRLETAIVHGRGQIRLHDSNWQVTGPDLPQNALVEVVRLDGVVLVVKPSPN
ncbi:MAG: NfeD family protein [Pseudomonadota bacterium]